jgi:hypothetical protein
VHPGDPSRGVPAEVVRVGVLGGMARYLCLAFGAPLSNPLPAGASSAERPVALSLPACRLGPTCSAAGVGGCYLRADHE